MAQPPVTRKESPEKDVRHASRSESETLPPYASGEPRPGQLRSDDFPTGLAASGPHVGDDKTGVPIIKMDPGPGTTAKYTLTDVITYHQAEDAGQDPPKRLEGLPEDAVRKAKLTGIIHVSDEERESLQKEADEEAKQKAQGRSPAPPARIPSAVPASGSAPSGAGKTPAEAGVQAKYDNR
jgi:hypothetical protein